MKQIFKAIIKFRKTILIAFGIIVLISIFLLSGTSVNYNMVDYLPEDANSTQAIRILQDEFADGLPNLSVMIQEISIQEALAYKDALDNIEGVEQVIWLDDVVGYDTLIGTPLAFLDSSTVNSYYKDESALYSLVIEAGMESTATNGIYELIGENNAITGEALTNASSQASSVDEVIKAMLILVPIIIIILIIATISWLEPILFMVTIGVAILINMGTNIIFGEVSFITQTVSPVLQLAVSMDYAIFLLHSFTEKRKSYEPKEAMYHAMKASFPTVFASALTTMVGFSALIFMRFGIGADLGLNLLKGIVLSFIAVMVFLPVVTLVFYKAIEKTSHRDFLPHPSGISKLIVKIRVPFLILAIIIILPMYLAQSQVSFLYGMGEELTDSRSYQDQNAIDDVFGTLQPMLLLIPKDNMIKEKELTNALKEINYISQVISYTDIVGNRLPQVYVPNEAIDQFYSENYSRIILYVDLPVEGDLTFSTIDIILETASIYFDDYYLTGQSATLNDMKNVVAVDLGRINLIAIIGIFIILLFTFKSLSIPLFLIFTIESAIWINLAIPYFLDTKISFIGYLIISTVQLGATVDYAILMTHRYMEARQKENKKDAIWHSLMNNVAAILVSASILAIAGFTLAGTTNNPMIRELGTLLGRGTLLSFIMVAAVLPALLYVFDKLIQKTTLSHQFFQPKEDK